MNNQTSSPLISIVIPAYNIAGYIGACLLSLIAQSETCWEAIVVDDGSCDGTADAVRAVVDPRIRLIMQSNAGVSHARNNGMMAANAPLLMFLDGDDLLHPTALARLSRALADHPESIAAFGTLRKILDDGAPYPGQKDLALSHYPDGDVLSAMLQENFLANGGHVLVRTQAARDLGGFNTSLKLSEDWEFWCRLATIGPFSYIGASPEVFYLRMRPGSASGGLAGDWNNHRASIDTVLDNPALQRRFSSAEWRSMRRRIMASHLWEAGRVNFTIRRFGIARCLMLQSLCRHPRPKRLALFGLAQLSQLLNRSLVSRLRFHDHDAALSQISQSAS